MPTQRLEVELERDAVFVKTSRRHPSNAGMTVNNCQIINWIIMKLAIYMKLWRVKHENTAWHTALQESDEFEVPGWEDLKGAIAAF